MIVAGRVGSIGGSCVYGRLESARSCNAPLQYVLSVNENMARMVCPWDYLPYASNTETYAEWSDRQNRVRRQILVELLQQHQEPINDKNYILDRVLQLYDL